MNKKFSLLVLVISSLIFACQNDKKEGKQVQSAIAAEDQTEAEIEATRKAIAEEQRILEESTTSLSFDKVVHDFGKVKEDSENPAVFWVTNTGKQPLIIEKVDVSCGCTTAQKPEKPILPGQKDKIEVVFHPKIGQLNDQNKTVTITANTKEKVHTLNIKAFVEKK